MNKSNNIYNLANALTLLRLLFAPIIVYGIFIENYLLSAVFFLLSNITDVLDGYVARRMRTVTDFGEFFDFLVDFVAIYAIIISLIIKGLMGVLNISLLVVGTVALVAISIMLAKNAGRPYMPHRVSSKVMMVLLGASFYLYFFKVSFADIFMFLSLTTIFFYTIPDYILIILKMKVQKR